MSYTKPKIVPALRDPTLLYGENGPGIYPDETVVILSDGVTMAAVSVERTWLANGAGIGFRAYARWINADGSSKTSVAGDPIESALLHTADMATLNEFTADNIAKDLALLVIGEPPLLQFNGLPLINIDDAAKTAVSIAHHVKAATDAKSTVTGL